MLRTRKILAILHSAPRDNNYLLLLLITINSIIILINIIFFNTLSFRIFESDAMNVFLTLPLHAFLEATMKIINLFLVCVIPVIYSL